MRTCKGGCGASLEGARPNKQYCNNRACVRARLNARQQARRADERQDISERTCDDCRVGLGDAHGNRRLCAECSLNRKRAHDRTLYAAHPERAKANVQAWRKANPDARRVEWQRKRKRWTEQDADRARRSAKRHYWRHRDVYLEQMREYRNSEEGAVVCKAAKKRWDQANHDKRRQLGRKMRAKRNGWLEGALSDSITDAQIMERDAWRCYICGDHIEDADKSVDHIWPLARGGTDTAENKRAAHIRCNQRKNDRLYVVDTQGNFVRFSKVTAESAHEAGWRDMVGPMVVDH